MTGIEGRHVLVTGAGGVRRRALVPRARARGGGGGRRGTMMQGLDLAHREAFDLVNSQPQAPRSNDGAAWWGRGTVPSTMPVRGSGVGRKNRRRGDPFSLRFGRGIIEDA